MPEVGKGCYFIGMHLFYPSNRTLSSDKAFESALSPLLLLGLKRNMSETGNNIAVCGYFFNLFVQMIATHHLHEMYNCLIKTA